MTKDQQTADEKTYDDGYKDAVSMISGSICEWIQGGRDKSVKAHSLHEYLCKKLNMPYNPKIMCESNETADETKSVMLKRCPFCAEVPNVFKTKSKTHKHFVWCIECKSMGCCVIRVTHGSLDVLVDQWNHRGSTYDRNSYIVSKFLIPFRVEVPIFNHQSQ